MHTDPELTMQVVGAVILILIVGAVFYWTLRPKTKYVFIPDDEKDLMLELMKNSFVRKLTYDDWYAYLVEIGMPKDQFTDLIKEVEKKLFD